MPRAPKLPKASKGQRPTHDPITQIEEAIVWLHALVHYNKDELTQPELVFLRLARKNLAVMHRRLSRTFGDSQQD